VTTCALFTGGAPGIWEILIIAVLVVLLFGAKRLPELSRSIGRSLGEFKKGREEGAEEPEKIEPKNDSDPEPPQDNA